MGFGVQLLGSPRESPPEQGSVSDPAWSEGPLRAYTRVHRFPMGWSLWHLQLERGDSFVACFLAAFLCPSGHGALHSVRLKLLENCLPARRRHFELDS